MKKNVGQLTGDIYALLEGQTSEDSAKIISSVKVLLGLGGEAPSDPSSTAPATSRDKQNVSAQKGAAKIFFDQKSPQNKGEEFAVAAMFRQETGLGDVHTVDALRDVIKTQARRTFDDKNFNRDIQNAIRQAKLFIIGNAKGEYLLSSYGEKYVAALPERGTLKQAKKSSKGSKKKKRSAK